MACRGGLSPVRHSGWCPAKRAHLAHARSKGTQASEACHHREERRRREDCGAPVRGGQAQEGQGLRHAGLSLHARRRGVGHHRPARAHPRAGLSLRAQVHQQAGVVRRLRGGRGPAGRRAGRPAAPPVQEEEAVSGGWRGHQGLEGSQPALPGLGTHREAPGREGHHPIAQEPRQEGRLGGHRHGLRPRGRAHRLRRPLAGARGQPRRLGDARPLLGLHQGRDRPRLRQPREPRPGPGRRGREPPVHRPHLGRCPHALPHDGALRRVWQRSQRRPRADAHAGPRGGARARAPRLQAGGLLGHRRSGQRQGLRPVQDWPRPGPLSRQEGCRDGLLACRGRNRRYGDVGHQKAAHPAPACAVQHHEPAGRCGRRGPLARAHHAPGREPLHGRPHLVPARGQHRLPALARPSRHGQDARRRAAVCALRGPAAQGVRDSRHARQAVRHRPPAHLPHRRGRPVQARACRVEALQPRGPALSRHALGPGRHRGHEAADRRGRRALQRLG